MSLFPPKPERITEGRSVHLEVIASPLWVAEPKLDGYRCIYRDGQLFTRHNKKMPGNSESVLSALAAIPEGIVLDGEMMDPHGRQVLHIFDIPTVSGTLAERRKVLEELTFCYPVELVPRIDKASALRQALLRGWEGVVFKRIDSFYHWRTSSRYSEIAEWKKIRL